MSADRPSENSGRRHVWSAWIWVGGVFGLYLVQFRDIAKAVLGSLWPF